MGKRIAPSQRMEQEIFEKVATSGDPEDLGTSLLIDSSFLVAIENSERKAGVKCGRSLR